LLRLRLRAWRLRGFLLRRTLRLRLRTLRLRGFRRTLRLWLRLSTRRRFRGLLPLLLRFTLALSRWDRPRRLGRARCRLGARTLQRLAALSLFLRTRPRSGFRTRSRGLPLRLGRGRRLCARRVARLRFLCWRRSWLLASARFWPCDRAGGRTRILLL